MCRYVELGINDQVLSGIKIHVHVHGLTVVISRISHGFYKLEFVHGFQRKINDIKAQNILPINGDEGERFKINPKYK